MNRHKKHNNSGNRSGNRSRNRHSGNKRKRKQLDHTLFVKKAEQSNQETYQPRHSFADFAFTSSLKESINKRGYTTPTPIQDQTIPALLQGRDAIGIAQTGTGKTAAFLLPLIEKVIQDPSQQVLVIAPTRELAMQIQEELRQFTRTINSKRKIYSVVVIGGAKAKRQIERLRRKPQFVIATPGRLIDLAKQGEVKFHEYQSIVLDEVDRMLDMGFIHDIRYVLSRLPEKRQSLFFSATLPKKMDELVRSFLHKPISVKIEVNSSSKNVNQDIVRFRGQNKVQLLKDILEKDHVEKAIVFGRTKWGIKKLKKKLSQDGFKVAEIHGNRNQNQRQRALNKFKDNHINVLLATNVAARGIDVDDITHVINYDAPESYDEYIHRIGRTGRAGKTGTALTFVDA